MRGLLLELAGVAAIAAGVGYELGAGWGATIAGILVIVGVQLYEEDE